MPSDREYRTLDVSVRDHVARIEMRPFSETRPAPEGVGERPGVSWELGDLLSTMREDPVIRVIVLTGAHDGEFLASGPSQNYSQLDRIGRVTDPRNTWHLGALVRTHRVMAEIEKPIVARVNGDAVAIGQSIMFSCDLIVARKDALVSDVHLGQGTVYRRDGAGPIGPSYGLAPGDGAGATVPLFMTPVKAKEYLMLSQSLTASELAAMGCINYAVESSELDGKVEELVELLKSKSAYALGWAKRIANQQVLEQLRRTLDIALAWEHIGMMQAEKSGFRNLTHFESDAGGEPAGSR